MTSVGDAASGVESVVSVLLLLALIYVIIEVAEGVPTVDFETRADDVVEGAADGLLGGDSQA